MTVGQIWTTTPRILCATPNLVLRGGIFSSRQIIKGKAFVCFSGYKTNLLDFEQRTLREGEIPLILERTKTAFENTRIKLNQGPSEYKDKLLMLLQGVEKHMLETIRIEKVCAASAASKLLVKYEGFKSHPDENTRNVYEQIHSLLVTVLNEKRFTIGDIKEQLDSMREDVVLVCRELPDSEVGILSHPRVVALVREEGGKRDHKTIVLKSLNKLGVVGVRSLGDSVADGNEIIVNGMTSHVIIRPSRKTANRVEHRMRHLKAVGARLAEERNYKPQTKDGIVISLNVNISGIHDVSLCEEYKYSNIGLVRTEYILGSTNDGYPRKSAPEIGEQRKIYEQIISMLHKEEALRQAKVLFRTLDLDGDKTLPFLAMDEISQGAIKERGFAMFLDPKNLQLYLLFKTQLEALLLSNGNKSIMFPNLFGLAEFSKAMGLVDEILKSHTTSADKMRKEAVFGIMVEHPGVIADLKELAGKNEETDGQRLVDLKFMSIGTNDLTRHLLGISRTSADLSQEFDELHPGVIGAISDTVSCAKALGLDVSLCGDMGNDPFSLMVLLGLGLRSISLTPDFVDIGRKIIRSIDIKSCEELVAGLAGVTTAEQIRQTIRGFVTQKIKNGEWAGLEPIQELILS